MGAGREGGGAVGSLKFAKIGHLAFHTDYIYSGWKMEDSSRRGAANNKIKRAGRVTGHGRMMVGNARRMMKYDAHVLGTVLR